VIEAVDDEVFFEGEWVSVGSDGDVHGVLASRPLSTGGSTPGDGGARDG
jgi:hypothetical protein